MLHKRARSHPKNQPGAISNSTSDSYFQSDIASHNPKGTPFLKVPGLFVGFNPGSSEFDSVRSPTSTLDFRIFSSFGNPFRLKRASHNEGHSKPWGCANAKVGLSIVDSLDDEKKEESGKVVRSFHDGKNVVFGRPMSVRCPNNFVEMPKSLPANLPVFCKTNPVGVRKGNSNVVFEIGEGTDGPKLYENFHARSLDSGRYGSHLTNFGSKLSLGSGNLVNSSGGKLSSILPSTLVGTSFIASIPTSEIELSEDYTCVRTHGPNPKVTHIFCDCILECRDDELSIKSGDTDATPEADEPVNIGIGVPNLYPPTDFLKYCYSCHKKLDGEDIYMYRGEKAFCSYGCRLREIEIDEEIEKTEKGQSPEMGRTCNKSSSSLFIAT